MVSTVQNFVTVRKTRGDILSPEEFRSIVEMIKGITEKYKFDDLKKNYNLLRDHIVNFNNPHQDESPDFYDEIVQKVYDIYIHMTPEPYTLVEFKTNIVSSTDFIELIRRIIMNRYLYEAVRQINGIVYRYTRVNIADDWETNNSADNDLMIDFGSDIKTERDFVRYGWSTNTSPIPLIYNASDLGKKKPVLSVVFETSSITPLHSQTAEDISNYFPIDIASNDFTVSYKLTGSPTADTTLLYLTNGVDTFRIALTSTKYLSVVFNNTAIIAVTSPLNSGRFEFTLSRNGLVYLKIYHADRVISRNTIVTLTSRALFDMVKLGIQTENLIPPPTNPLAIRELVIYSGYVR